MRKFWLVFLLVCSYGVLAYGQINLDYWMDLGRDKLIKKQYLAAIEDFNIIIRFKPDYDDAYYLRAIGKFYLGDYRGAIEDYTKAITIKPYSSYLYTYYFLYRGVAREKLLDFKGALDDYSQAIEVNPGNWSAYINRGFMYIVLGKHDKAIDDFNTVITFDRKNAYAYLFRAIAYHSKGRKEEAMADFSKAIQLDPSNPETYLRRGGCRVENKDYPGAIEDFSHAVKLDSTLSLAYFNRAVARREVMDYNGAMYDFNKVIELDPQNDLTYYNRADLKAKVGDFNGAIHDYTKVLSINPSNIFSYFNRAVMWQRLNNHRKAIEDYSAAIRLYSDFASAYFNRAIARQHLNDHVGAARDYEIAERLNASFRELKQSDKLDSTGLAKLENFTATFDPGDKLSDAQNKYGFEPIPNYRIDYIPKDSLPDDLLAFQVKNTPYLNFKIREMNEKSGLDGEFIFGYQDDIAPQDQIERLLEKMSEPPAKKDSALQIFSRAILKKKQQDYNGALDDYTRVIKIWPKFSLAYFNRANTRYEALSLLRSFKEHRDAVSIDMNNNIQAPVARQKTYEPNYQEVIEDYEKCIALDPQFCYAYFNLANVKVSQKDLTNAIINYTQAIHLSPTFGEAYYNRGLLYLYIHEREGGCSDLSRAGEYGILKAYDAIKKFCNK